MILFRYLARELAGSMIAVTTVLMMILMSGRLIRQLADAASGQVSLEIVLFMLLLRLPSFLEMILPLALFISILLAYGRLYAESEMTILTATGISNRKLLGYTLIPAAFLMLIVASFTLVISPWGAQKMEELYKKQAKLTEFELLIPGRFQSTQNGSRVTYSESLSDDKKEMRGVFIADGKTLLVAERGTQYVSDETGSRFLELHNGRRYDIPDNAQLNLQALDFDLYGVKIADEPEERRKLRKEAMPTFDLLKSDNPEHQAQLHWRLSLIFMVPIVTLIAFPLSKVNPRQGRFARLFPAIVLFMVYISLIIALVGMVEKGKIPVAGLWGLHSVYLLLGLGLLIVPEWLRRMKVKNL